MAFPATLSSPSSSTPTFPLNNPIKAKTCQPKKCLILRIPQRPFKTRCVKVVSMSQSGEPSKDQSNEGLEIEALKTKRVEAVPVSVKELPWKRAPDIVLKQLFSLVEKTLKWCLVGFFALSFVSDVTFSISTNRELVIPVGLFVGCFVADVLKEAMQQLSPISDGKGVEMRLIGIGCLFAAVRLIAYGLPVQVQAIVLHVANGGFLQVLWLWRGLFNRSDRKWRIPASFVVMERFV